MVSFPYLLLLSKRAACNVKWQDMGVIVAAPYPTLLKLADSLPYAPGGWGSNTFNSGVGFNDCVMYFGVGSPPASVSRCFS